MPSKHTATDSSSDNLSSFSALLKLLKYAKGHRRKILLAISCSIINKVFDVMPEILIGIAIDVVVNKESSFVAGFGFETPQSQIAVLAVFTFLIWAGESLFEYFYLVLWRNLSQRLQAELRQETYVHMQSQGMAYFENHSTGELISILNDDVNQLERFLDGGANDIIQTVVTVLLVGGVFFYLSPAIALLAFTPIPVIIWGAFFFLKRATPLYADVREQVGKIASKLANNIGGIVTIKSYTAEDREAKALAAASEDYVVANSRAIAVSSAFIPVIRMAILVGFLFTFVYGGLQALHGNLNVGAYGVLVFLTQRLLWPLTDLAKTIDLFERAMASTRRIFGVLESPVQVADAGTQVLPIPVTGEITFNDVQFRFAGTSAGLSDFNLTVPAGKTTALVGVTGSGKSTVAKLILRLYEPNTGVITFDDINIASLSLHELRSKIGFVGQDVFMFDGTVADNIRYGDPSCTDDQLRFAVQVAQATDFINALPEGLDSAVGERGSKLSGGQRQRLSLARAIVKNPPVLILDEATSAVDNETEAAIQKALEAIGRDRTVLIIAHRLSTIINADNIVVLESGRVVEHGTHSDLLNAGGAYSKQWSIQSNYATQSN